MGVYVINPLMGTLKLQSNRHTVFGTLATDVWAVTLGTAKRGLGWMLPCPFSSALYQM